MRYVVGLLLGFMLFGASEEAAVRKLLADQTDAWNRGNIEEFVRTYDNSPLITFVGKTVSRGYEGVLSRYRKAYPDALHMGRLRFDEIEVRMLGKDYALIIGRFQLERKAEGGGPASGRYSLIAHKTSSGWKIIHDHTSS